MTIEETIALMLKNEESPAKIQEVKDAWEEKKKNKKKEEAGKTGDNVTGANATSGKTEHRIRDQDREVVYWHKTFLVRIVNIQNCQKA